MARERSIAIEHTFVLHCWGKQRTTFEEGDFSFYTVMAQVEEETWPRRARPTPSVTAL